MENYEFALTIEPDNKVVQNRLQEVKQLADKGLPTVPSTIGQEKRTNIFLLAKNAEVFAELRSRKDRF